MRPLKLASDCSYENIIPKDNNLKLKIYQGRQQQQCESADPKKLQILWLPMYELGQLSSHKPFLIVSGY